MDKLKATIQDKFLGFGTFHAPSTRTKIQA